ncbi:MAG TPA: YHS domain-containing protein [Polyangia bacterium]|nr:YHS domain-containing protein [Polyangia bacterium]
MLKRDEWLEHARDLDWELSYVREEDAFPPVISGAPWLPREAWRDWDEPYRTTYADYVATQTEKDASVYAVRDVVGKAEDYERLPVEWKSSLKLHAATLPLAEFAAVIGNLRAARFGRSPAWRTTALFGALDELRHTQIPLSLMHELVRADAQLDWTHKFYHSNNWVAIAARHLADEMLLGADPVEFAVATNFVFETGFTNLQFVGLAALAHRVGDKMFQKMVTSIQSDEARHSQIGAPTLATIAKHDRARAQHLVDKWFWRSWQLFAIVTGFSIDYLTPLASRTTSFRELMDEWIADQYLRMLDELGLDRPWYWPIFEAALPRYHHMVYASAYSYRATVWFDLVVPGPDERAWLREKYPESWDEIDPIWARISERWRQTDPRNDFGAHGTAIVGFCDLCQIVLCGGSPGHNGAQVVERDGKKHIFCSEPCRWIFEREPARYAGHKDVVKRVLAGEAPANLVAMLREYFGLTFADWGKDAYGGLYPWLERERKQDERR